MYGTSNLAAADPAPRAMVDHSRLTPIKANSKVEDSEQWHKDFAELNCTLESLTESFARSGEAIAKLNDTFQALKFDINRLVDDSDNDKKLLLVIEFAHALQYVLSCQFSSLLVPASTITFTALEQTVNERGFTNDRARFAQIVRVFQDNGVGVEEINGALFDLRQLAAKIKYPHTLCYSVYDDPPVTEAILSEAIASAVVDTKLRKLAAGMLRVLVLYHNPDGPLLATESIDY